MTVDVDDRAAWQCQLVGQGRHGSLTLADDCFGGDSPLEVAEVLMCCLILPNPSPEVPAVLQMLVTLLLILLEVLANPVSRFELEDNELRCRIGACKLTSTSTFSSTPRGPGFFVWDVIQILFGYFSQGRC